jgi:hypothetical protein
LVNIARWSCGSGTLATKARSLRKRDVRGVVERQREDTALDLGRQAHQREQPLGEGLADAVLPCRLLERPAVLVHVALHVERAEHERGDARALRFCHVGANIARSALL